MTAPDEEFVLLGMPDVHGSIRGKALRPLAFQSAVDNGTVMTDLWLGLDPVDEPIADYEHHGIRAGAPDLLIVPETETLRELSWRPGWRICLATPSWRDGSPCDLASREVLRDSLAAMVGLGYEVLAAFEYEVRLWDRDAEPLSSGLSYHLNEIGRFDALLSSLVPALEGLGVELEAVHTEAGPGLLELNIEARSGLRAADDAAFVKFAVKDVAAALGLRASFLAKTMPLEEGSSGHVHLSLWRDGTNAFAPAAPADDATPVAAAAIAGVLDHLPAASLLLNPTVNSYKRLVPGYFAPVNVSWGYEIAPRRSVPFTPPATSTRASSAAGPAPTPTPISRWRCSSPRPATVSTTSRRLPPHSKATCLTGPIFSLSRTRWKARSTLSAPTRGFEPRSVKTSASTTKSPGRGSCAPGREPSVTGSANAMRESCSPWENGYNDSFKARLN